MVLPVVVDVPATSVSKHPFAETAIKYRIPLRSMRGYDLR
jgi:hypothetical protein